MAGSRLHNFGTIFSRMTGLLESGAVTEVPIWYEVYKRFPPAVEPTTGRTVPTKEIREIVYKEDYVLANKPLPPLNAYQLDKEKEYK